MGLQFRRGTAADVTSENFIPAIGEPVYITDEDKFYIGDGATVGGNLVGGAGDLADLTNVHLTTEDIGAIQSYSVSSNTVTINTSEGNPYVVNQQITISNAGVATLNGTHTIVSKPAANQFLFELTTADVSNTVTTGTTTPVIANGELLSFDSTNSRFTNKKQSEAIGKLSNHSDVDGYDSTSTAPKNNSLGKILRYDTDNNWSLKRPGEAIKITSGQHFIGVDFSAGTTGNIYTGNASDWTEDTTSSTGNNGTDLHSASPGSIPPPPYGDAAYDSNSHDYNPVGSFTDSTDFTLDFWLYKPTGSGAWVDAMLFYSNNSPSYKFFYPEYSGTALSLYSAATTSGTVSIIAQKVIEWTVPELLDQWVHVSIVRKGTDFRAWVNGEDEGAGTLQGSFTSDHNFLFSSAGSFYSIQYENDTRLIGPHYVDLQKAHRDPAGGNIDVPIERVDFNNNKSGVNVSELLDVTNNAFIDGDILTYHQGLWTTKKPTYAKLFYRQTTAPTSTIQFSDRIGEWTGLTGVWRDMTYENLSDNNNQGPKSPNNDPTLLLEDSVSGTNTISGITPGIYQIDLVADFVLNNLSANSYNSHWLEILFSQGAGLDDVDTRTHFTFPAHTATSTAITLTQKASIVACVTRSSAFLECKIDQEQGADYYISQAVLSVSRIG